MSLEFAGFLYSGDNRTGQSMLVGVGHTDRYNHISAAQLTSSGLYANIHSVELITTSEADGNLVLLKNDDYSGPFAQVSDAQSAGDVWWSCWGHIGSVLLIAGNKKGTSEHRISFHDQFHDKWTSFLDAKLQGKKASRQGDPTLTWEMFPANVSYLDPNLAYLKIYQPLHITMPWYWPDYAASMTYHIYLYVTGDHHLRAWGARWAYWVEGGAKSGKIADELMPEVRDGLQSLQDQVNQALTLTDLLGPITDVYYLPGRQPNRIATGGISGATTDDVTIVIEQHA
ncbi:MAG: hypothetical protein HIU93_13580 [Acidobacteria bacterium]|nr:hypothetical protein [Acidobacteriota bacterium]MBW4046032.1 hypothetical protein [Acidobacteriota bacterium]